jgi:hypothetical protein
MCAVCFCAAQLIPATGVAARFVWVKMTPDREESAVPLAHPGGAGEEDVAFPIVPGQ